MTIHEYIKVIDTARPHTLLNYQLMICVQVDFFLQRFARYLSCLIRESLSWSKSVCLLTALSLLLRNWSPLGALVLLQLDTHTTISCLIDSYFPVCFPSQYMTRNKYCIPQRRSLLCAVEIPKAATTGNKQNINLIAFNSQGLSF